MLLRSSSSCLGKTYLLTSFSSEALWELLPDDSEQYRVEFYYNNKAYRLVFLDPVDFNIVPKALNTCDLALLMFNFESFASFETIRNVITTTSRTKRPPMLVVGNKSNSERSE